MAATTTNERTRRGGRMPSGSVSVEAMIAKKTAASAAMINRVADAIAKADGADPRTDATRYRRLAVAALTPLAKPTAEMIDAAHQAVWSDGFWAINSRRDFQRAVRAMMLAAMKEGNDAGRP